MLNLCIFLDLKLTIYNPFYVRSKRNKNYALLTVFAAILGIVFRIVKIMYDDEHDTNTRMYILYAIAGLLILTHIFTIQIVILLCRKGTS